MNITDFPKFMSSFEDLVEVYDVELRKYMQLLLDLQLSEILWHVDPLLGNDRETNN
jgi:hypothetical protein